ncbi:carbohydrate kinase family protein [Phytohabitans houttuyneae]|uniref:Sulfofructose kinase n=1 Tax=Phytohabitans houttuyneae TaxID=1076126 RepID=A0A6V8KL94_9ACTN|nr:carbohydrate kinase family protein [Phytohabitans houttuyneae]GFJ85873.1 sulfofructose kinase [Phytohabitans houttuyneae]
MSPEVICVGAVTVDTIAVVDRAPGPDGRVVAEPFTVAGGGPAATAAVTLARLGVPVGFCGVVGDDAEGALSRALLEQAGVDTTWLATRPGVPTARSMIVVSREQGTRMIVTTPSAPVDVPPGAAPWLHADQAGYPAVRGHTGARRSLDGGNPVPGLVASGLDLYAPSVEALTAAFPAPTLADSMRAAGARQVVATAGADGCYVLVDGEARHVPPVAAPSLVSTMGAGDVFHGALLAGLVQGRSLLEAAWRANAVAALSCRALDGRTGIPDADETERFLSKVET